jgi:hypothetical protein
MAISADFFVAMDTGSIYPKLHELEHCLVVSEQGDRIPVSGREVPERDQTA